jgi:hypothetical protein
MCQGFYIFDIALALIPFSFVLLLKVMGNTREYLSRILAVGSPAADGVHRLTQGDSYVCCEGSQLEHQQLRDFCQQVEELLEATGQSLEDFTPEQFADLVKAFADEKEAR